MDKNTFLNTLKNERVKWDALIARIDENRMEESGASGDISVKDTIFHITWFEQEMVNVLNEQALCGVAVVELVTG